MIFQVSSDVFWGYRVQLNPINFNDLPSIIAYIKNDMKTFFLSRNLQCLAEMVDKAKFHIHHPHDNYKSIIELTNTDETIYVCDHC